MGGRWTARGRRPQDQMSGGPRATACMGVRAARDSARSRSTPYSGREVTFTLSLKEVQWAVGTRSARRCVLLKARSPGDVLECRACTATSGGPVAVLQGPRWGP